MVATSANHARRRARLARILRDGALHRGVDLARRLGVSPRTIYRDMARLVQQGLPIAGQPGSGYRITAEITLPPLNLTRDELEALHLGLAVMREAADADLQAAARSLADKIDAVLPEEAPPPGWRAPKGFADPHQGAAHLAGLRAAIRARQKILCTLHDGPARQMRPLRLDYWNRTWTLTAWCESTDAFDRIAVTGIGHVALLPALFADEPGKRLADADL